MTEDQRQLIVKLLDEALAEPEETRPRALRRFATNVLVKGRWLRFPNFVRDWLERLVKYGRKAYVPALHEHVMSTARDLRTWLGRDELPLLTIRVVLHGDPEAWRLQAESALESIKLDSLGSDYYRGNGGAIGLPGELQGYWYVRMPEGVSGEEE